MILKWRGQTDGSQAGGLVTLFYWQDLDRITVTIYHITNVCYQVLNKVFIDLFRTQVLRRFFRCDRTGAGRVRWLGIVLGLCCRDWRKCGYVKSTLLTCIRICT